jgi:hypothetical protein
LLAAQERRRELFAHLENAEITKESAEIVKGSNVATQQKELL